MSAFKITPAWSRAIPGSDAFAAAWGVVLNALSGGWGSVRYPMIPGHEVEARLIQGAFVAELDIPASPDVSGTTVVSLPMACLGVGKVTVQSIVGGAITATETYIVEDGGDTASVVLPVGRKLVTATGTARRV